MNVTTGANTVVDQGAEGNSPVNDEKSNGNENYVDVLNENHLMDIPVLLCMQCRIPLVKFDNIINNRAGEAWMDQVYAYELDIFEDKPPLWCYSATNPSTHRFDLIRCSPTIATEDHLVTLYGEYSNEHPFFVGHSWCYCNCGTCGAFLGWAFSRPQKSSVAAETDIKSAEPNFIGLILTKCVGKDAYPFKKFEESVRGASDRNLLLREKVQTEDRFFDLLNRIGNRQRANHLTSAYHQLAHGMTITSILETLRSLLHIAEDVLQVESQSAQLELEENVGHEPDQLIEQGGSGELREEHDDRDEVLHPDDTLRADDDILRASDDTSDGD